MLNGLDLFSGIGGISLALRPWVRTVAYCENDRYCQGVLLSRMSDGSIDEAPIWDDVQTLSAECFSEPIDIISGGFPCQDISVAGNGAGLEGKRSGLFFEVVRLCKETKARWVFLENSPAIRTKGLNRIISEFTDLGYDCRWTRISAAELGAKHIRERWFLLAHTNSERLERLECKEKPWSSFRFSSDLLVQGKEWLSKHPDFRVGDELPVPVDRIKGLGNAVVPLQAREAFIRLMGIQ